MNEIESFFGPIENTADALRVFELCRQGRLGRVRRRLHDKERRLIRSGSVFVFDEQESGIRRWTDGRLWSPSRILGNFLIYRELERRPANMSIGLGESDDSTSTNPNPSMSMNTNMGMSMSMNANMNANMGFSSPNDHLDGTTNFGWLSNPVMASGAAATFPSSEPDTIPDSEEHCHSFDSSRGSSETNICSWIDPNTLFAADGAGMVARSTSTSFSEGCANSLLGPNAFRLLKSKKLQASAAAATGLRYTFKPAGLIKKTISARVDGRMQHLVCYFSEADFIRAHSPQARSIRGPMPELLMELRKTSIPADLVLQQNFRKQPTTEYGFPLGMEPMRGKRRHSMHLPSSEHSMSGSGGGGGGGRVPICPRVAPELLALDLETSNWPLALQAPFGANLASSIDEPLLLPEHPDLDAMIEGISNSPGQGVQPVPPQSTSNIMEACIRMVLGSPTTTSSKSTPEESSDGKQGLCVGSSDPALPVVSEQEVSGESLSFSF